MPLNNGSRKPILIVEDDDATREAFALILARAGYPVSTACNGEVALEQLRRPGPRPGLILLDLMMPHVDGFQFRRQQKQDAHLADIPVLICSASGGLEERAGLDAVGYLAKPVEIQTLLHLVSRYC